MFRSINHLIHYLSLDQFGALEMIFALYPIFSFYKLNNIPLAYIVILLMVVVCIFKTPHKIDLPLRKCYNVFGLFVIFWLFHELMLLIAGNSNSFFINQIVSQLFFFGTIIIVPKRISYNKLKGSLNIIALVSMIGLLYQWTLVYRGIPVHPLEIPGLPLSDFFQNKLLLRPSSFFPEPAAYVGFMLLPLAISLIEKKYLWTGCIVLSLFLSTSTTGVFVSFILLFVYLISQNLSRHTFVFVALFSGLLLYGYVNLSVFNYSKEKIEETDTNTNVRLSQGPRVIKAMQPTEFVFGTSYSSAYDFCMERSVKDIVYYGQTVYMSTFWMLIFRFGLIGLCLYLLILYKIYKAALLVRPFLVCIIATLFSDPTFIGSYFMFELVFMFVLINYEHTFSHKNNTLREDKDYESYSY